MKAHSGADALTLYGSMGSRDLAMLFGPMASEDMPADAKSAACEALEGARRDLGLSVRIEFHERVSPATAKSAGFGGSA
jgi:hypothetical protein